MAQFSISISIFLTLNHLLSPVVQGVGVNYGTQGDNLPNPASTLSLLKSRNVNKIRIFEPTSSILDALRNTNIAVYIGVNNLDLKSLATDPTYSTIWVKTNILPYAGSIVISGIVAGNEFIPGDLGQYALGAMIGLYNALQAANINVPVTTAVQFGVMGVLNPPSAGEFGKDSIESMKQICGFLQEHSYPILANIYPYYSYIGDKSIDSDFVFFKSTNPVLIDGDLKYYNIFDAMIDAMYSALAKAGAPTIDIIVSETGWPSSGNDIATVENARLFNQNVINHVESGSGTPKRPNKKIETYIFAIYNENSKPVGTEQFFGLYNPDQTEVYHVDFPAKQFFGWYDPDNVEDYHFDFQV